MRFNNAMGERAAVPQNNEPNEDEHDENMEEDDGSEDELSDMTPEEINTLNNKMDELNSALDTIEEKNDVIYSELLKLLQANKEIRLQMENQSDQGVEGGSKQQDNSSIP